MRLRLLLVAAAIAAGTLAAVATVASGGGNSAAATPGCPLGRKDNKVQHVIYVVFDNTHYRRDNPSVPSDLEQMPHLLNFITGNGTLQTNHHTILISHTAGGILSSMTGLYPDRNGITVSNSYPFFQANGNPTSFSSSAFKYWTDVVDGSDDSAPNMIGDGGQTTPPPWVPFAAAGCNVGGVSAANIELENANTSSTGDIARVYGNPSPEFTEAGANPTQAQADFVGIAIHCAKNAAPCQGNVHSRPDDMTTVPGSNDGYLGLFGAKYVNPAITGGNTCVNDTDGNPIKDPTNTYCGFPGFDGAFAKNSLGMVAQMQENGVPVTYAYISDAHDNHSNATAYGPGEAGYKQQLKDYDIAFDKFFTRLANDGINKSNTLFVFTVDEGDHFAGGTGASDGAGNLTYTHALCSNMSACPANQIGEVTANLKGILSDYDSSVTTGYTIHFDDAPTVYVNGNPSRADPVVRKLEQDSAAITGADPYANPPGTAVPLAQRLADTVEEKTLHMINNDPKRTPTFTFFGNADFFFQVTNSNTCGGTVRLCVDPKFAWNHGDYQDEIANNWLGLVGPGVDHTGSGIDTTTWSDHTDVRPTMLSVLGLSDSYVDDGRVLMQLLSNKAISNDLNAHEKTNQELADIDKQLNAPFGDFGLATLAASTKALASTDPLVYDSIEAQIGSLTQKRDDLAGAIRNALDGAAFRGMKLDENQAKAWIDQAQDLIAQAQALPH
jgi:Type I phosphodiesterase / nucleotide pyrophosphatase